MTEASADDLLLAQAAAEVQAAAWRRDREHQATEVSIDTAIADVVPGAEGDVEGLATRAERLLEIAPFPIGGPEVRFPKRAAKQVVRKVTLGPLHHLATQMSSLGSVLLGAIRSLDRRVGELERTQEQRSDLPLPQPVSGQALARCRDRLRGATGVVLHVDAGDGRLLGLLRDAGVIATGVEASPELVVAARRQSLDVRLVPTPRTLGDASDLAGVVLTTVDALSVSSVRELVRSASDRLRPGGLVVVVSLDPSTWSTHEPVLADLAPGRPLSMATWRWLLHDAGLLVEAEESVAGGRGERVIVGRLPGPAEADSGR